MMILRELTLPEEFEECLALQREGFGWSDPELMPMRFFVVSRHIGGLVLGAFDGDTADRFSERDSRNSRMEDHTGILICWRLQQSHRDSGVGTQLKFAQKEHALKRGIRLIEWTFDPLVSRNAYLNIEKLGVIVRRYYPSFYGGDSDRLIAEWWLDQPRPSVPGDQRRVTIAADSGVARDARLDVRKEFLANFKEDFYVAAFERHGETSDYVFVRGASRVDLTG